MLIKAEELSGIYSNYKDNFNLSKWSSSTVQPLAGLSYSMPTGSRFLHAPSGHLVMAYTYTSTQIWAKPQGINIIISCLVQPGHHNVCVGNSS